LILFVSFSPSPLAIADSTNDPGVEQWGDPAVGGNGSELVEELLSLLDASRSQVEAILEQLDFDGVVLPYEVNDTLSLAEEAASEALLLMEEGLHEDAADRASKALQLYGDALQMALGSNYGVTESTPEDNSTEVQGFWGSLERGYAYLREVDDTAQQLAEAGVNVSKVDNHLAAAEGHLVIAEELLLQGDTGDAREELDLAFQFLDGAVAFLQSLNEDLTAEKAAGFLANSERRLERLEEEILRLIDPLSFEPEDFDALMQALEDAHLKNRDLKNLLEGGDLSSVLDGFESLQQSSDGIFDILEDGDKDVAKYLKKAFKVELRISHHEDVGDPKGLEATLSEPDPEAGEDLEGAGPKGQSDKEGNNGNGRFNSSGTAQGNNSQPSIGSGGKGKGKGKSNGGGLKKGYSDISQENE
jgi:tetratricopeptide (TPR) repeat protein